MNMLTKSILSIILFVCIASILPTAMAQTDSEDSRGENIVVDDGHEDSHEHESPAHDHATDHGPINDEFNAILFAGKLHPMVVHFPIALLITASLSEIIALVKSRNGISEVTIFCLLLGTISALVAVMLGWANASGAEYSSTIGSVSLLTLHRWAGVSTLVVAILACSLAIRAKQSSDFTKVMVFRGVLFTSAILVSVAGHLGASLVFGLDYFS